MFWGCWGHTHEGVQSLSCPVPWGPAVLVRCTIRSTFHAGKLSLLEKHFAPLSPEQYDMYLASKPTECRPLASMLGDVQGGKQLLADYSRNCCLQRISELARDPVLKQTFVRFTVILDVRADSLAATLAASFAAASLNPAPASSPSLSQTPSTSLGPATDSATTPGSTPISRETEVGDAKSMEDDESVMWGCDARTLMAEQHNGEAALLSEQ